MPEVLIQVLLAFGRRVWSERSEWEVVVESRPRGVWDGGAVRCLHPLPAGSDVELRAVDPYLESCDTAPHKACHARWVRRFWLFGKAARFYTLPFLQ